MALCGHHLGDDAGHWPCAAFCPAADERPADGLLWMCFGVGDLFLAIGFWSFGSWLLKTGMSLVARALISYRSQKLIGQHSQVVFFSSCGDLRPYSGSGGFPVPPGPGAAGAGGPLRVAAAAAALARLARDVGVAAAAGTTRRQTQKCWLIG